MPAHLPLVRRSTLAKGLFSGVHRHHLSALLLAASLSLTPSLGYTRTPGEIPVGAPLRDLSMRGLNGPDRPLSAYRGKPLVLNVWASWCGPCRAEMGSLVRLAQRLGPHATVIGISTDDHPERAQAFLRQTGIALPMYIDRPPWPLENMLGADRLPLTLLIDAQGLIRARHVGAREWDSPAALNEIRQTFKLKDW